MNKKDGQNNQKIVISSAELKIKAEEQDGMMLLQLPQSDYMWIGQWSMIEEKLSIDRN